MRITAKDFSRKMFWIILGVLLIYFAAQIIIGEIVARRYKESFGQIQHPVDNAFVDSLQLSLSYYPATYVDDSIQFKSAILIGELRSSNSSWNDVQAHYENQTLADGTPVVVLPLDIHQDDQRILLDFAYGYAVNPLDFDILAELQDHYVRSELLKTRISSEENLYLVYSLWQN